MARDLDRLSINIKETRGAFAVDLNPRWQGSTTPLSLAERHMGRYPLPAATCPTAPAYLASRKSYATRMASGSPLPRSRLPALLPIPDLRNDAAAARAAMILEHMKNRSHSAASSRSGRTVPKPRRIGQLRGSATPPFPISGAAPSFV